MPSSLDSESLLGQSPRRRFISLISDMLRDEQIDKRDEWSTDLANDYTKGAVLSNGRFGMVVAALCREVDGRLNSEPRSCVLKVRYIGRCVDKIMETGSDKETLELKFAELLKRLVVDVYIMSRMRHRNIIHLHAVTVNQSDVTFVLPRFYCLENIIQHWRTKMHGESMPADMIMRIIRQVCIALDFLKSAQIVHRTVQADHIYLTRNGTVKLAHFSAAKLMNDGTSCVTPVGNREYLSFEKQFNLYDAENREACIPYDCSADVWALGVIILRMISFFPNEQWQRLQPDFAYTMHQEKMPFKWIIADLTQLRVRMRKASDSIDLCRWLSDKIFTVKVSKRYSPAQLLESKALKKLCFQTVEEDSKFLVDRLISMLDWPNRDRLETNRPNYDCLESKDIPAEFYWDDSATWKLIERAKFSYDVKISCVETLHDNLINGKDVGRRLDLLTDGIAAFGGSFLFSEAHLLLSQMSTFIMDGQIYWTDVLPLDAAIREGTYAVMREYVESQRSTTSAPSYEHTLILPRWGPSPHRECSITVRVLGFKD